MKKISIVVPVYNSAQYLPILADSLILQTYKNKEIILVDDGSEDESGRICDEYAEKYEFVKAYHIPNSGVQNARNIGLMKATGDYIAFVDSDDALDLDCYEILINELENNNSDIAACGFKNEFSDNMHIISLHNRIPEGIVIKGRDECLKTIGGKPVDSARYVWNKVFKREILDGVRFRPEIAVCDDLFFTYEAVYNAQSMTIVDLPMYHYRYASSGIVQGASVDVCERCVDGLELLNTWMEKKAPFCRAEVYANYIFRNTKICERMLDGFIKETYLKAKNNIKRVEDFIPACKLRIRISARAILKSWTAYKICGTVIRSFKVIYIRYKRSML